MIRRVLITRAAEDCRHLQDLIGDRDLVIEPYPVLRFEPVELVEGWGRALQAQAAASERGQKQWLLLASPRAPQPLCEQAPRHGGETILALPAVTVGRATAHAATEDGLRVELTGPGTGAGLATELTARFTEPGLFVFACGVDRRPELPDALRGAGHTVIELEVYRMVRLEPVALPVPVEEIFAVVLTSPRSTRYYVENLGGRALDCPHIALGPTTREAARTLGIQCRIPARPEMETLVEELCTI